MRPGTTVGLTAAILLLSAASSWHLTLVDSRPREDAVLADPPSEIWLRFNERPDAARSGISLRGPSGAVRLDSVRLADSLSLAAPVLGALEPGEYTVSWLAAPHDDHAIRGRYQFTVEARGASDISSPDLPIHRVACQVDC